MDSFTWKPFYKQEQFLAIPTTIKEGFYAGAVNAGKSDVLLMYPAIHGWTRNPRFKGLFLRRTFPELEAEIIPRSKEYYRPLGGIYNTQQKLWTFPSGATIRFGHCEKEDDVHNYDSAQYNYVAFDELTSFTEWQYVYITVERTRRPKKEGHEDLPAIVRSASNPGNTGHTWVYERFIKPNPDGFKILRGRGGIKRIFIPATIEDNPYADPVYKAELDALPEAERKAKKFGDWSAYEGQVFSEFRDRRYPNEPENAIHVIDSFEIPSFWPRLIAIDWGYSAMTYICYGAVSPNKRLYIYREQSFVQTKIEEWAPEVAFYTDKEQPVDAVICHSAGQHRGEPHTIQEQVESALNMKFRLSEKDRIGGKMRIHEFLRFQPKKLAPVTDTIYDDEQALWLLRNKGIKDYKSYCAQFQPQLPEMNLPKVQLFKKETPLLQSTIKSCIYDKTKVEDVAEFKGDDPYDCFRYLCTIADNFFTTAFEANERLLKQQELIDNLEKTQNMTAFYMNARRLEEKEKHSLAPVPSRKSNRGGFYGAKASYSRRIH